MILILILIGLLNRKILYAISRDAECISINVV